VSDFSLNPLDPDFRRNPFDVYARGREIRSHRHVELPVPLVSIFGYDDCQDVLRDHERFSNYFPRSKEVEEALGGERPQSMLGSDPPRHTRLRNLVGKAFTPRIISRLESHMHEIADELVQRAIEEGEVDLVQSLTYPLPVQIIAEIIGVPAEDREQFKHWSDALVANLGVGLIGGQNIERQRAQLALLSEMHDYFVPLAEQRRLDPQEDLLTGLVQAKHEGSQLDDDEMLGMITLLLVAGNETTTTLIGNVVLELAAHPEAERALREDPSLLGSAIEEVLRYAGPIQLDPRRVVSDTEIAGTELRENDMVLCWLGSANRDERVFDDAATFDIRRKKNPHLSFGFGTHYCIGANLARLEARVAVGALLRHTKSFELANTEPLPLHSSPVFRAFTKLPLRLQAA
jgi:cytochrome P450